MDLNYTPLSGSPGKTGGKMKVVGLVGGFFVLLVALSVGIYTVNKPQTTNSNAQAVPVTCPEGEYPVNDIASCNKNGGVVGSFLNTPGTIGGDGSSGGGDGSGTPLICCRLIPTSTPPPVGEPTVALPEGTPQVTPNKCLTVPDPEVVNVIVKCPDCT